MKTKKPAPSALDLGLGPIVEVKSLVSAATAVHLRQAVGRFFKSDGKFYLVASVSLSRLDNQFPPSDSQAVAQVRELDPKILHGYKRVYGAKVELVAMLRDARAEAPKPPQE